MSDIEIARNTKLNNIVDVAKQIGKASELEQ
jgi:formyltetrahydrofolate synthetase